MNSLSPEEIVVNNAGIYEFAPLENVTEEHCHKMFDLNVLGGWWKPTRACRENCAAVITDGFR